MTTMTAVFASSVLTLSIGLYFSVILALFGLLVLAGSAGHWTLARTWCPALFEHSGTVFVLIAITLRMHDLALFGLACIALGRLDGRQGAASLNQKVESVLLTSALMSVCAPATHPATHPELTNITGTGAPWNEFASSRSMGGGTDSHDEVHQNPRPAGPGRRPGAHGGGPGRQHPAGRRVPADAAGL
jgi:hypothetical protein